jgi:predicted MFS family arabinose efflux permease
MAQTNSLRSHSAVRAHAAMREVGGDRSGASNITSAGRGGWPAVAAVAVGTFSVVTVESLPAGLLTSIAGGLRIPDARVGLMVTVSGLVAALAAAVLPVAIGRLDRRAVLVGLIALTVLGNVLTAVAPDFPLLLVARFVIGISIGGFWSLAAGLAVRLVPARDIPKATSVIFSGAMAANVLGIPAGTLLGALTSWRAAFAAVAGLGALLIFVLLLVLPKMPAEQPVRVGSLIEQLRTPAVRVGVLATFLLVSGHYGAFTFVSPILQKISGIHAHTVGVLLLGYGIAAIAGNFLAGSAAARNVRATIVAVSVALAATLVAIPLIGTTPLAGTLLLIVWGAAFGGLPVSVQTWILQAAPTATEAATGLNTCTFNLAIAAGSLSASVVGGSGAISGVLWLAAALVALTSFVVWRTPAR